jgi:hypothetical protein
MVAWGKGHLRIAYAGIRALLLAFVLCLTASLAYPQQSSGRDSTYAGAAGGSTKQFSTRFGSRQQFDVAPSGRPGKVSDDANEEARQRFGRDSVYAGDNSNRRVTTLLAEKQDPVVEPTRKLPVESVQRFGRESVYARAKAKATAPAQTVVAVPKIERPTTARALGNPHLVQQLDHLRGTVAARRHAERRALASITVFASAVSYGFIWWLLQGGLLLGSLLSALPAWVNLDPLPVLAHAKTRHKKTAADDDGLEGLFGEQDVTDTGYGKQAVSTSAYSGRREPPQKNPTLLRNFNSRSRT